MKFITYTVTFFIAMIGFQDLIAQKSFSANSTKMDSISYSVGLMVAENIKQQGLHKVDIDILAAGIQDAVNNTPAFEMTQANQLVRVYLQEQKEQAKTINMTAGAKFLATNADKEGIVTLESGLQYLILQEGDGPKPSATDRVTVHYHGTLIDGTVFDSSIQRGKPATFGLNQVISGWTEGLQLMPTGSKYRLFLPSNLAYGDRGAGGAIGPNSTLIFDVELLEIVK